MLSRAAQFSAILCSSHHHLHRRRRLHEIYNVHSMTTGWASFGLHPVLMTLAFGLFMPLSALSYRGLERLLGVSHAAAKATHGTLMLVALILGVLGFIDMWIVHQNGKGSGFHFISVHSWVGILVLVAAALQYLSGLSVFSLPASPPSLRKAWLPAHVALGSLALFGGLAAIALGILSFDYKHGLDPPAYATPAVTEFKFAGMMCCLLGGALAMVFAAPKA